MNLNQEQCKHLANVLHTLAIAMAVPAFLKMVGLNAKLDIGYGIITFLIIAFFALEFCAIVILHFGDKSDDRRTT